MSAGKAGMINESLKVNNWPRTDLTITIHLELVCFAAPRPVLHTDTADQRSPAGSSWPSCDCLEKQINAR